MLKELPNNWISNGSTDFAIQLKPPDFTEVSDKALAAEGSYSHWSLFDRFCLVNELLDASDSAGSQSCPPFSIPVSQFYLDFFIWSKDIRTSGSLTTSQAETYSLSTCKVPFEVV